MIYFWNDEQFFLNYQSIYNDINTSLAGIQEKSKRNNFFCQNYELNWMYFVWKMLFEVIDKNFP